MVKVPVRHHETFTRDFRITDKLIEKFGFTPGCGGCEAQINGTSKELHTTECQRRLKVAILADEIGGQLIERRDKRRAAARRRH